jgi:hypothetical protein
MTVDLDEVERRLNKPLKVPATNSYTRRRIFPGDGDRRHGTHNGYDNLKCRCDLCCVAERGYRKMQRSTLQ